MDEIDLVASPNGLVKPNYDWKYAIKDQDDVFGAKIGDRIIYRIGNNKLQGPLKWKGLIAGFKCLAIDSVRVLFALTIYNWPRYAGGFFNVIGFS